MKEKGFDDSLLILYHLGGPSTALRHLHRQPAPATNFRTAYTPADHSTTRKLHLARKRRLSRAQSPHRCVPTSVLPPQSASSPTETNSPQHPHLSTPEHVAATAHSAPAHKMCVHAHVPRLRAHTCRLEQPRAVPQTPCKGRGKSYAGFLRRCPP